MAKAKHDFFAILAFSVFFVAAPVTAVSDSASDAVKDARIQGQITSALALNQHLSVFDIEIDVDDSTVVLEGKVQESIQKDLAEEIALGVDGVEQVDNRIEVEREYRSRSDRTGERTFGDRVSDATTTATVRSKLLWNRNTQGLSIGVSTEDGVVTLEGEVDSDASKELAERLAMNTDNVNSVDNQLRVNPNAERDTESRDFGDTVSDAWITTKVRSTLTFSTDVPARNISIETKDGVVHLSGNLSSAERARAIELASDVDGVVSVQADELKSDQS